MGKKGGREMLRKAVVVAVFAWILGFLLTGAAAFAVDYTYNHYLYHYHGGWEGMRVRHSRAIPCEEADRWAPVAQKIWRDILEENPSLADPGFTFSVVEDGELGSGVEGEFMPKFFRSQLNKVFVVVRWDNGEPLNEILIVENIAHELDHLRQLVAEGTTEGCYPFTGSFASIEEFEEYFSNVCEQAARDFAARYLQEHLGEILEILEED